jgi:hypothetical protein
VIGAGQAPERLTCSRAGCRERATSRIEWRNPKIHAEDRVKVWLACDEHVEYLREFLAARQFPLRVVPADAPSAGVPIEATTIAGTARDAASVDAASAEAASVDAASAEAARIEGARS